MPKPSIVFTEAQKKAYRDGTIEDASAPTVRDCLAVGFRPQDVVVDANGQLVMPGAGLMNLTTMGELVESLKE